LKVARLNYNENPFGFPKEIIEKVIKDIDEDYISRYTKAPTPKLRKVLTDYVRETARADFIDERWITVTPGADGAISLCMMLRPRRVVVFPPTYYFYYNFAKIHELEVYDPPLVNDMKVPDVKLEEGDMVFLPNPNNPTGHLFEKDEILKLLESPATVVIDEAYFEFSWVTSVQLLEKYSNLIILRTFSKAFAFAGQRFGYIIAHPAMISRLDEKRNPYNIPSIVMKIAEEILKNRDIFLGKIKEIEMERRRLAEELEKLGFKPFPSHTNFLYFKLKNAEEVREKLADMNVFVRAFWGGIRVTVGKREENNMFLSALKEVM
jgi:histidinol-phosphate aminotransferase